jgi:hypothetical protein
METGPIYRIAYLGTCHGGDFDLATRMVSAAAEFGMQGVAIDWFRAESLAEPGIDSNYARYKAAEFRPSQYERLADMTGELGMDPIFHPRDLESLLCILNQCHGLWTRTDSRFAQQALALAGGGREVYLEASGPATSERQGAVLKFSETPLMHDKSVVVMQSHSDEISTQDERPLATRCHRSTETRPQILTRFAACEKKKRAAILQCPGESFASTFTMSLSSGVSGLGFDNDFNIGQIA